MEVSDNKPEQSKDTTQFINATVSRITFRNEENGFAILRVDLDKESAKAEGIKSTSVVGVTPQSLHAGAHIIARGTWQTHEKFGRQFRAWSIVENEPTTSESISRYLASGVVRGFGPTMAQRVVDVFGDDTLQIIDQDPEKLLVIPGIGERKLDEIVTSWNEKKAIREVLFFFQQHDISLALANRIINIHGERAIEKVKENPYLLARDVWGIGFQTADHIAAKFGIAKDDPERIIAGVSYCLKRASDDGHCFLPNELLVAKAAGLLEINDEALILAAIEKALLQGELIRDEDKVYLPSLFSAEEQLARDIAKRLLFVDSPARAIAPSLVESLCNEMLTLSSGDQGQETKMIRLSQEQQQALQLAAEKKLVVITGGPGCGKTTVLKTIAKMFRKAGLSIKLAAPTGRAAQRLSEVCGMEASTIHRLLKYDPSARNFVHNQHDQLPLDVLIVDESSMIDIQLAAQLFRAISNDARIVVVGDADQLPSVGPGLVLADLLESDCVPRVRLTQLFRRDDESAITVIAHQINAANVPHIPQPDGSVKSDAYFLPATTQEEAATLVEKLVIDQIPKKFGFSGSEIMVLTPMNQGELGVIALNKRLQTRLVPALDGVPTLSVNNLDFRLGDRVVQRMNNYNIINGGIFNGDQGEIIGLDVEQKSLRVRLWDGREAEYKNEALYQLDLAYALTIHRSQGSEVPVVVLALHQAHHILLERQLIYTGVTRAKKLLIIVGSMKAFATACNRSRSNQRHTALKQRISNCLIGKNAPNDLVELSQQWP